MESGTSRLSSWSNPLRAAAAVSAAHVVILAIAWGAWHAANARPTDPGITAGAAPASVPGRESIVANVGASNLALGDFLYRRDAHAGSTGVVDEADIGEVVFSGHKAKFALGGQGRAMLRYHIQPYFDGLNAQLNDVFMFLRFTDNGDNARVIARLKRLNTVTGQAETLLALDSDDFPQLEEPQIQYASDTTGDIDFEQDELWWVEVTLIKLSPAGRPEVEVVEVSARDAP